MAIRLGLGLPQARHYDIGRDVPEVARAAERVGYESLWVFERALLPEPATQGLYGVEGLPWPELYRHVADPLTHLLGAWSLERARDATWAAARALWAMRRLPDLTAEFVERLDAAVGFAGRMMLTPLPD
jgi:hypothetical protein